MVYFTVSASFPDGKAASKAPCRSLDEARAEFRQWRREGAVRIIVTETRGNNGDDRTHKQLCDWQA